MKRFFCLLSFVLAAGAANATELSPAKALDPAEAACRLARFPQGVPAWADKFEFKFITNRVLMTFQRAPLQTKPTSETVECVYKLDDGKFEFKKVNISFINKCSEKDYWDGCAKVLKDLGFSDETFRKQVVAPLFSMGLYPIDPKMTQLQDD